MPKKVTLITLGCRVNQSESAVIEGSLRYHGASIVSLDEKPDYCIINTCTVTAKSDSESRQLIRRAEMAGARVIVTGCYSQLNRTSIKEKHSKCEIIPIDKKMDIVTSIVGLQPGPAYAYSERFRPYLKVQDGCNFGCSYCAVPNARGRSVSVPFDQVISSALEISSAGFNEVVLTGIHIGLYGKDLPARPTLSSLIKRILSATDIKRIRLSSIEINEIDDEMIELLSDPRICRHLHIPLQSGSDFILKSMRRSYNPVMFENKMNRLSDIGSDFAFGTDVIAGFPGESSEDFIKTIELIKRLPFSYIHVFPYSIRPDTLAAEMKPQIASNIISERTAALRDLSRAKKQAFALSQTGKMLDIIIEERASNNTVVGTSSNYLKIAVDATCLKKGSLVFIRYTGLQNNINKGYMIN